MRLVLLALAAVFLPLLWGWAVHWFIERCWPERGTTGGADAVPPPASVDFQI